MPLPRGLQHPFPDVKLLSPGPSDDIIDVYVLNVSDSTDVIVVYYSNGLVLRIQCIAEEDITVVNLCVEDCQIS